MMISFDHERMNRVSNECSFPLVCGKAMRSGSVAEPADSIVL